MANSICDEILPYQQPTKDEVKDLYSTYIISCVFNTFLSYTTIMLNVVTIRVLMKTSSLPAPLRILLLSLAFSDLGVGLLCQPFAITMLVNWLQNSNPSCAIFTAYMIMLTLFTYTSFYGVMALSIDRFLAIHLHLRYQELVTRKRVVAAVFSKWGFSLFLSLMMLWIPSNINFVVTSIVDGVCIVTTTFLSYKIYSAVRRHKNQIQNLQVQQNGQMANAKSALGAFYVYVVFLLCYLPHICTCAAIAIYGITTAMKGLSMYTLTMLFLNSCLNPVIYCWKMRQIRRVMMDILRNILPRHN